MSWTPKTTQKLESCWNATTYRKLEVVPCARSWLPKSIWNFSPLKSSSTNKMKSGNPELYKKEGIQPFRAWHKTAKQPGKLTIGLVQWLVINLIGTLVWFKSLENQTQTHLTGVGAGGKNIADTWHLHFGWPSLPQTLPRRQSWPAGGFLVREKGEDQHMPSP